MLDTGGIKGKINLDLILSDYVTWLRESLKQKIISGSLKLRVKHCDTDQKMLEGFILSLNKCLSPAIHRARSR